MISFALLGCGRIGSMHAKIIAKSSKAKLTYVYDFNQDVAQSTAAEVGAIAVSNTDEIFNDPDIDAVLIATPTDTHVEFIKKCVAYSKAVLCEKPIDLNCDRVKQCWHEIKDVGVPVQIGFNRRFDPTHSALKAAVEQGKIGDLEQLHITSRDPDIAPAEYLAHSGGIFRDMVIHDFDMARFLVDDEPTEIYATGSRLISPELEKYNDVDSAIIAIKFASGKLCQISVSRRCVYGYDQRIEAFGSEGMLQSDNPTLNQLKFYDNQNTKQSAVLNEFFIERYGKAYENQIDSFIENVANGTPVSPSFEDGMKAQDMAEAAHNSLLTGAIVRL